MIGRAPPPPPGYVRRALAGGVELVALERLATTVAETLEEGTLHDFARVHPRAVSLAGRGIAYAIPLPDGQTRVVVRHSRHGGLLAPLTRDRFLSPTRAPHELATAVRLADVGVPTPEVVAYVTYPAGPRLRRSDVATREIPRSRDLGVALLTRPSSAAKSAMLTATARLLSALAGAGARHRDLNLKNVLLTGIDGPEVSAYVLDVDRVAFAHDTPRAVATANFARLARSVRKWRGLYGVELSDVELEELRAAAGGA